MKAQWQKFEAKIDALTLRERAILFCVAAVLLGALVDTFILGPKLKMQKEISQKVSQDQQQIMAMQAEVQAKIMAASADPDKPNRVRLESLKKQSAEIKAELLGMQKGLVSPDKMATLLEDILRRNGHLRLVSLKTIPVAPLMDVAPADPKSPVGKQTPEALAQQNEKQAAKAAFGTVYKHAVEITVQGGYLDMMNYLAQLESMPWQLFWGKAQLDATDYQKASLTLTLFTLSLDKKWLNI